MEIEKGNRMWRKSSTEYKKKVKEYQEKLYSCGIQETNVPCFPLEYWEQLAEAFGIMYNEFPVLYNSIKRIGYRCLANGIGIIRFLDKKKLNYDCIEYQTMYLCFLLKYRYLSKV